MTERKKFRKSLWGQYFTTASYTRPVTKRRAERFCKGMMQIKHKLHGKVQLSPGYRFLLPLSGRELFVLTDVTRVKRDQSVTESFFFFWVFPTAQTKDKGNCTNQSSAIDQELKFEDH